MRPIRVIVRAASHICFVSVIFLSSMFLSFLLAASLAAAEDFARVHSAQGTVESAATTTSPWTPAVAGQGLLRGAAVRTAAHSRAGVIFLNGVLLRINELSLVQLNPGQAAPNTDAQSQQGLTVQSGDAYFFSRDVREFPQVDTPLVSAAIRGTEFSVSVRADLVKISVLHGSVEAKNQFGSVLLSDGEEAVTLRGQAPTKAIMVKPKDAVQWALYYPAFLEISDYPEFLAGASAAEQTGFTEVSRDNAAGALQHFSGDSWRAKAGRSIASYALGDTGKAFAEVHSIAPNDRTASLALYEAALLLSVGQVDEIPDLLREAEERSRVATEPVKERVQTSVDALGAIIAIVRDDYPTAEKLSAAAIERSPQSSGAALTASYVSQSRGDLDKAYALAERASQLSPKSPATIARQAEILLGMGRLRDAEELLSEGSTSQDSRLLTVSGFAALTRNEVDKAADIFRKAESLDQQSGLPLLGLGLATIRRGDVSGGRAFIEQAVMREPSNALLRSYLGKAFFEEEENGLAERELTIAKRMDPNDPTPYLYSAYNNLSSFRPVEALSDIEESIDRNANRAVYRSRLLLDQDLAVRGIGLAQVYNQLGFEEAARDEAVKSIQRDYSNYSAHLLLAGSYTDSGDRFSTALLSEFFLSQLLAPRDFVFFARNDGSTASFNEYASLFERRRIRTNVYGGYSSATREPLGGAANAGTFDNWSYIGNLESSYSRGYRSNDFERNNTGFLRAQYQPVFDTSISTSTLVGTTDSGDSDVTFDPQGTDPDLNTKLDIFIQQVGLRHQIEPGFLVISQAIFARTKQTEDDDDVAKPFLLTVIGGDEPAIGSTSVRTDRRDRKIFETYRGDLQVIRDTAPVSLVGGIGATEARVDFSDQGTVRDDELTFRAPEFEFDSQSIDAEHFARGYGYSNWHIAKWLDLTAGASVVHLEYNNVFIPPYLEEDRVITEFDPKTGFSIYLTPDTTLRGAYFQNLGTISLSETGDIEPTLVGGFNQNVLDVPGVRSENFGIALAHKIAKSTYVGSEFLHRELDRPINLGLDGVTVDLNRGQLFPTNNTATFPFTGNQQITRSYLHQVLSQTVATTLKHTWTQFDEDLLTMDGFTRAKRDTNEVTARASYFDPSGVTVRGEAAWRLQTLEGFGDQELAASDGTRDFWLLNAGVGYQLPRRYGTLSLSFNNILDQEFRYLPTGLDRDILPERSIDLTFSLTF